VHVPLPNFFLVGAPKAGTTALYRYLDQHPAIYMSPIKEPHFFADEIRLENFGGEFRHMALARLPAQREYLSGPVSEKFSGGPIDSWADYLKLFQCVRNETAIGEASVCYLWSESAPANLYGRIPDAKILVMLRKPIERAFSQYAHMLSFAESEISFGDYIDAALRSKSSEISELFPFLRFGSYGEQLERWLKHFDASQVQIHLYEDFCRAPLDVMRSIFRFLGVDAGFTPNLTERHMEAKIPRSFRLKSIVKRTGIWEALPETLRGSMRRLAFEKRNSLYMTRDDRIRLADYYRSDLRRLSGLLEKNLDHWLV
jgi:hypothetical protein